MAFAGPLSRSSPGEGSARMMKRSNQSTAARVLTTLAVAFVSGGCAMKGDIRTLQDELRAVTARQDSLMMEIRAQTAQTQDTLRTQGNQMFDLRGDINRQLQLINQSLTRIEALAGENQRGLTAVRDQLVNMRRAGGGTQAMPLVSDSSTGGAGGGESLLGGGAQNPDELYGVAMDQFSRGSLNSPVRAAAATITGLISTVRPVGLPCLPLKLRLLDEAQSWSPTSLSGFMPRHIEQPGARHSKPAARNTSLSPSASAALATSCEPGTINARTPLATWRPRTCCATSRRSLRRLLVQLPMNVTSTLVPLMGAPASSCM